MAETRKCPAGAMELLLCSHASSFECPLRHFDGAPTVFIFENNATGSQQSAASGAQLLPARGCRPRRRAQAQAQGRRARPPASAV